MHPKLSHQLSFLHVIWTRVGLSLTTVTFPISNSLLNSLQMKQRMSITSLWNQLILWFMFPSSTQLSVMHLQYIEKWLRESWVGPRNKGSSISKLLEHVHCKTENTLQQFLNHMQRVWFCAISTSRCTMSFTLFKLIRADLLIQKWKTQDALPTYHLLCVSN